MSAPVVNGGSHSIAPIFDEYPSDPFAESRSDSGADITESSLNYVFHMRVAGVSFHNRDGRSRQEILAELRPNDPVRLEHEPGNVHDRHAIRLMTAHGQIGYVPASIVDIVGRFEPKDVRAWVDSTGRSDGGLLGCRLTVVVRGRPALVAMLDFHCLQGRECRPASLPGLIRDEERARLQVLRKTFGG